LWFDDQADEAARFYTSIFKFNEAISFQAHCDTQEDVDYHWESLSQGGDEKAQQCGRFKDKYGVSWQIVPTILGELVDDPASERSERGRQCCR
jgi:predicted 3-demethylubiquinone-9 3-methyltransferase (glyoxalase superfamily)